jgi:hypothetical protein
MQFSFHGIEVRSTKVGYSKKKKKKKKKISLADLLNFTEHLETSETVSVIVLPSNTQTFSRLLKKHFRDTKRMKYSRGERALLLLPRQVATTDLPTDFTPPGYSTYIPLSQSHERNCS